MKTLIFGAQLLGLLQLCKSQTPCTPDVAVAVPVDDSPSPDSDAAAHQSALGNIGGFSGPPIGRLLRKRAALECTSSESCYSFQGEPFCADDTTLDFHDEDGTTGNLDTGDYTLPDGRQGNLITGPYPLLTASSISTTFDASAASATGSSDSSTITKALGSADTREAPTGTTGSTAAVETGTSSPTRTSTSRGSASVTNAATSSPEPSAAGAPTRYTGSYVVVLAVMGLRAML